ncbi:chorismate lyase [Vibrio hippocampi]|uniref:Probable chorismate pyruvate-lyase n=1 Tax=Vibrio hippocampi TaxID=654686 RepID=A0ABM8ZK61_9VIBR|nr:chorismate lyase [Vibrio hippocampi]CAH0527327.1 Chorismate pyruvate-lyase [Vibrio hippocampi]
MNKSVSEYRKIINQAQWQTPEQFQFASEHVKQWLMEQGSLTHKLLQQCQNLTVDVVTNAQCQIADIAPSESELLEDTHCWLREVVLHGDSVPWLVGRTLMPVLGMEMGNYNLSHQGNTPLGETVFASQNTARDALELTQVTVDGMPLYARRSRIWVDQTPMLVTELFLPDAPIYIAESHEWS